jgi:hypothetical protein
MGAAIDLLIVLLVPVPFIIFHFAFKWDPSQRSHRRLRLANILTPVVILMLPLIARHTLPARMREPIADFLAESLATVAAVTIIFAVFLVFLLTTLGLAKGSSAAVNHTLALRLRQHLHARGHHWITQDDAARIISEIGSLAYKLPNFDEVATTPKYVIGDTESIVRMMLEWKEP